jgi:hypothetical protein
VEDYAGFVSYENWQAGSGFPLFWFRQYRQGVLGLIVCQRQADIVAFGGE